MLPRSLNYVLVLLTTVLLSRNSLCQPAKADEPGMMLIDFAKDFDLDAVVKRDAKAVITEDGALRLETGAVQAWPGIDLRPTKDRWDLSKYEYLSVHVKNVGDSDGALCCRVDNPGANGRDHCMTGKIELAPGATGVIKVTFEHSPYEHSPYKDESIKFIGMRGAPIAAPKLDSSNVVQLVVFTPRPKQAHAFEVSNIHAGGTYAAPQVPASPKDFFPMIDEFGQYMHRDWPRKTHTVDELRSRIKEEEKDFAAHPEPGDWNRYGGWASGPQLKATGFFRVEKHKGKWWLVDPEGRLFWSNGIDCVRPNNATPITDREHYYAGLPKPGSPFDPFYGKGRWAPRGYYQGRGEYRTYDFTRANLLRKYGENWQQSFAGITHRRFRSWGINTIANWSSSDIYLERKTPYVATIHYWSKVLQASRGLWKKFSDVFDPSFRDGLAKRLAREKDNSAGDPWCIGYFVDNELGWGDEVSLALATLQCPPEQKAKQVFVADLKTKYGQVERLNAAWGTSHASWDALLQATGLPDRKKARPDLEAFYTKTAETYFKTIRDEVKKIAPDQLYLGCRFSSVNDRAARASAKYCDVVSRNRYRYSVEKERPPTGVDVPMIIGEFHFGALDRGMFHTGLRKAKDQKHRAELYAEYVQGALRNPHYVGVHWFQYKDQATTGRGDGENYQIGFVDGCDTPYPEIIAKSREVGYTMYEYRMKAK